MTALQKFCKESDEYNLSGFDELSHDAICALITIAERQQKEIASLTKRLQSVEGDY